MALTISEVKKYIEVNGEITVDCGNGSFRNYPLSSFRNSTEAAIAAIEGAKRAPYICCNNAGECSCKSVSWQDRISLG